MNPNLTPPPEPTRPAWWRYARPVLWIAVMAPWYWWCLTRP